MGQEADIHASEGSAPLAATSALVMSTLALDALALRVIGLFEKASIEVLLMKGPVTQRWLYADDPFAHPYTDVDLLVDPVDRHRASEVLRTDGLRDHHAHVAGLYRPRHETAWVSEHGVVDLHHNLWGIPEGNAHRAWQHFLADASTFELHGRTVRAMGLEARVVQIALHAAHAGSGAKAVRDLARAATYVPDTVWSAAASLAGDLGAGAAFASGLQRLSGGDDLMRSLGLRRSATPLTVLAAKGALPEAMAIARLFDAPAPARGAILRSWLSVAQPSATAPTTYARATMLARLVLGAVQWLHAVTITWLDRTVL